MNEKEQKEGEEKLIPTFIMVPRKLMAAWISVTVTLFVLILAQFQYTNYVDRTSNHKQCGMLNIFYEATKASPEKTEIVRRALFEFELLLKEYNCIN